eukprot:gene4483-4737_t
MGSHSADQSVDSELAAILDEELFDEGVSPGLVHDQQAVDAEQQEPGVDSPQAEQLAKRSRKEHTNTDNVISNGSTGADIQQDIPDSGSNGESLCPPHPGWWMDMCIRCGAVRSSDEVDVGGVSSKASATDAHSRVSAEEAVRVAAGSQARLLASRRLILVLDLDHTLLNTVRDSDLAGAERTAAIDKLRLDREQLQEPGQQGQPPQLFHLADKGLWTKLRPGVAAFLAAVSPLYELHIYTMGDKGYAGFQPGVATHMVVAPDRGDSSTLPLTDKVQAAQRAGVPIVHPDWLIACKFSWSKQLEADFALPGYTGGGSYSSTRLLGPTATAKRAAEQEKQAVMQAAGRAG